MLDVYDRRVMGMWTYLESRDDASFDPASKAAVLFTAKGQMPFAWFLLFEPSDFRAVTSGSVYTMLQTERERGVALARKRLAAIQALASEELHAALVQFVDTVLRSHGALVVLDSNRLEASREELVEHVQFVASLRGPELTPNQLASGDELFPDSVVWGEDVDDEDGKPMELGDDDQLTGRANTPSPAPVTPAAPARIENAALAAVFSDPDSLDNRLAYAASLPKGDLYAEFIRLDAEPDPSTKKARRLEALRVQLATELERPFGAAAVSFEHGFAASVAYRNAPVPVDSPWWTTVHTLELRGAPPLLTHPAFRRIRRAIVATDDVVALQQPVPFISICVGDPTPALWRALAAKTIFPALVEVFVKSLGVWLPAEAQALIRARPGLRVRATTNTPFVSPIVLQLMSPAERDARIARWTAPAQGARLAGARFDV